MATNIIKIPTLRTVTKRGYAQVAPVSGITNYEVKNSTLPNKLVVASAENESPISRVSIIFRAGSRNETADNLGVTHCLRVSAGNSTRNASRFAIIRNIQQVGASLQCTSDRELISYTLEGTREAVQQVLPFLTEVATQQIFKPWEVADNVARQRLELATRPPQLRAVDLLHKAAFRSRGLGNSLYSAKYNLGKISPETLQHYVASNFTPARAAVIGVGVDHSELVQYAQSLKIEGGEGQDQPSPYKGGEIRSDKGGDLAFVALAGEGGSYKNPKETLAFAVLERAIGGAPKVKWGSQDNGLLSQAVGTLNSGAVSALNVSYSDSGLFGALVATPYCHANKVVKAIAGVLKSGNISDADFNRGKNQLRTALLLEGESGRKAARALGVQATLIGNAQSAIQVVSAVDSISKADVDAALKKVSSSKLTIASVGNLAEVPFLDDIQ